MLMPTSSPVPPHEGAPVSSLETGVNGVQDPLDGVDSFPPVLEGIHPGVTPPRVDPVAHNNADAAQILPEAHGSEAEAAPPIRPWPIMDPDSTSRTDATAGTVHEPQVAAPPTKLLQAASPGMPVEATFRPQVPVNGQRLEVESPSTPNTPSGPKGPNGSTPVPVPSTVSVERSTTTVEPGSTSTRHGATLPAGGELQRVELAVHASQQSGNDARVLLAPPTAPTLGGEQVSHGAARGEHTSAPSAPRAAPPPLGRAANLMSSMMTLANGSGGVARLRLDPPLLGEVIVQLTVHATGVDCSLQAARSIGAEALVKELSSLRTGLEARGLIVDRMVVHGPQGMHESPLEQEEPVDARRQDEDERNQQHRHGRRNHPVAEHEDESWLFQDMLALEPGPDHSTTEGEQVS